MLTDAKTIRDYKLNGIDGEVGSIKEFLFDDKHWTVRYLAINTGGWLSRRQVLISPYFLQDVDHESELIDVNLTKGEIEDSPSLETDKPVSRQFEEDYYGYYGAPIYWGGPHMWGPLPTITRDKDKWNTISTSEDRWDPSLRSSKAVTGYAIQSTDGEIGHVDDFIIDDDTWTIRYFVVDTNKWLPGKKVIISPEWIDRISWEESKVFVNLSTDVIKKSPQYNEDLLMTRDYETKLHQYYNRKGYWSGEESSKDYSRSRMRQ